MSSPLRVAGRGQAYEGTIRVEVRDDGGRRLHSGYVQAGADGMAPFRGTLELAQPTSGSGILILSGDTGAGPTPDMTVARLIFTRSA